MSEDVLVPPERDSLASMEVALEKMQERLNAILSSATLEPEEFVEVAAIFNNVSYIFLYLEANDTLVDYATLVPYHASFYANKGLDNRLLERLTGSCFDDPELEEAREDFTSQINAKYQQSVDWADERIEEHKLAAKNQLAALMKDQQALLERILKTDVRQNPAAVFYRFTSRTENPQHRSKLGQLWRALAKQHGLQVVPHVDAMVATRHEKARVLGAPSPLTSTLKNCRVSQPQIEAFLETALEKAVKYQEELEGEIVAFTGAEGSPLDSFAYYMRQRFGATPPPTLDLSDCITFLFNMGNAVFGLDYQISADSDPHVLKVDVIEGSNLVGRINFDLWATHGKDLGANHTLFVRNRGEWGHIQQLPEAYVACRFIQKPDQPSRITFQNVHSLYHEFGHAMNHLLIRERIPSKSGLEYLPIERLELLSMWSEKWVYHPEFVRAMSVSPEVQDDLHRSQMAKTVEYRRTFVERAAIAALDFKVHQLQALSLASAFDDLDRSYGIGRFVELGDIAGYFTWPMYLANPGANFTYLWGAAHSCEVFEQFMPQSFASLRQKPETRRLLDSCFDFEQPSHVPDVESLYSFYEVGSNTHISGKSESLA